MPIISSKILEYGTWCNTPEDVQKDEEGMQIMRILGKKYGINYLKCYRSWKRKKE
ncbi:MAG: hypothetical protein V8R82_02860 [Clostridia bacterium]